MPRIARGLADNHIYHILNRGNGGLEVFNRIGDYKSFIALIYEAKEEFDIRIFSYCLMPNHFHLVLMPIKAEHLSKMMQWVLTSHVRRYHGYHQTSGHIWQGRYKSFLIQEDNHLLTVMRYVEANPVRAGLVKSAKAWHWSSHREWIRITPRTLVDPCPIELPEDWNRFVNQPLTEQELDDIHQSIMRNRPFGSEEWQLQMCRSLGLESTLRPRGRPRRRR
ncbi:MAG TPA: transposase [bacterium (Candidatus Stahlbacteria)]|nr:transposase [Candidatus Stahlbacteria bacterium]